MHTLADIVERHGEDRVRFVGRNQEETLRESWLRFVHDGFAA